MTTPYERIAGHPLREATGALRHAVEGLSSKARQVANDHEPRETIERAAAVADWVEGLLDIVDPLLVPTAGLDAMVGPLQAAAQHVRNSAANPAEVANASTYLDQAFVQSGPLVVATPAVRETASQVARGFGQALGHRTRALKLHQDELAAALAATRSELDEFRQRTTHEDEQRSQALIARVEQLSAAVDQMQARIEQFVATSTEQFDAEQRKRQLAFEAAETERSEMVEEASRTRQELFDAQLEEVKTRADRAAELTEARAEETDAKLREEADDSLAHVAVVRDKVDKLYSIIAKEGTAGAFHDEAKDERDAANTWRRVSLGFAIAAIGAAILSAFVINADDTSWPHLVAKLAVTVGFGGVSAYAGQQSSRHRHREEQAKQLELDLTAIGPFIEDIDGDNDGKTRDAIRQQFVDRWMASRAAEPTGDGKTVPINLPIDRILEAFLSNRDPKK